MPGGAVGPTLETCDGKDNDCDGKVDDLPRVALWFDDGDGDFHGAKGFAPVAACDRPTLIPPECGCTDASACPCDPTKWQIGLNPDDCKDDNPLVYPGATETCNGIDDNCNGTLDEGIPPSSEPCEAGLGECARTGTKTCLNGTFSGCSVAPGTPVTETCDNRDNDCDGVVDNALFAGEQVPDAACFQCLEASMPTTLSPSKGDYEFGGSVDGYAKLQVDNVFGDPTSIRVRFIGVLLENAGDNTSFTWGGSQERKAQRAIARILTQDSLGTFGYGSNAFGGYQVASGKEYTTEPARLDVLGDTAGLDHPGCPSPGSDCDGSYVNPYAKCIWVELQKN